MSKFNFYFRGFTLSEILIVLVIIGVLSAILIPLAFQSSPDENVMKFKKAHNTLLSVIRELVSSDEYYQNGDLGIRANGALIDRTHDGDVEYFCNTIAQVMTTKSVNCSNDYTRGGRWLDIGEQRGTLFMTLDNAKKTADTHCKERQNIVGAEIITSDDVIFYNATPGITFGIKTKDARENRSEDEEFVDESLTANARNFGSTSHVDDNGFDRIYKIYCIDIDGINKGEDPFGYGIRADGKMVNGYRADEWLQKSINKKD